MTMEAVLAKLMYLMAKYENNHELIQQEFYQMINYDVLWMR